MISLYCIIKNLVRCVQNHLIKFKKQLEIAKFILETHLILHAYFLNFTLHQYYHLWMTSWLAKEENVLFYPDIILQLFKKNALQNRVRTWLKWLRCKIKKSICSVNVIMKVWISYLEQTRSVSKCGAKPSMLDVER